MRLIPLLKTLTGVYLLALCTLVNAEPMLNGISVHEELGKEQFIGAVFSESLSNNADTLMNSSQAMRIELKIVAPEGLTNRRFSNMWIEGMAINSKADALTAQADNMVKFTGLFKGRFLTGDHIVFASTPTKGVDISVNGVVLGNIADYTFFSMLLSTWIGKVPLSSDYRDNLLKVGDVNASLRSRFDGIKPSAARVAEINIWKSGATVAAVDPKVAQAEEAKKAAAAAAAAATTSLKEVAQTVEKPAIPDLATSGIEKPSIDVPKLNETEQKPVTTVAAAKPVETTPPAAQKEEEEDEDNAPVLTAATLLARQTYFRENVAKIRSKTRYPGNALQKGQEGSVRISVVVNRKGEIVSMKTLEESRYAALNKEATGAIKRSEPFAAMPAELSGKTFEFTVPIRFTLPKLPKK